MVQVSGFGLFMGLKSAYPPPLLLLMRTIQSSRCGVLSPSLVMLDFDINFVITTDYEGVIV